MRHETVYVQAGASSRKDKDLICLQGLKSLQMTVPKHSPLLPQTSSADAIKIDQLSAQGPGE